MLKLIKVVCYEHDLEHDFLQKKITQILRFTLPMVIYPNAGIFITHLGILNQEC